MNSATRIVRLGADANCYLAMSSAPVATSTGGWPLFANTYEYVGVKAGMKFAVISS
jgi:hypothetical protein